MATDAPPAPETVGTQDAPRTSTGGEPKPRTSPVPRNYGEARGALLKGFATRVGAPAANADGRVSTGPTTEESAAQPVPSPDPVKTEEPAASKVDSAPQTPHNTEQTPPPAKEEPATATAPKEPLAAEPSSEKKEPVSVTPSVTPTQEATKPAAQGPRPLPAEFESDDLAPLHQFDPTLRRQMRRIWNQPNLSEVAKVRQIEGAVSKVRQSFQQTPDPVTRRASLAREGRVDELAEEALAEADGQAARLQYLRGVTHLIAQAADTDPDDPDFKAAGSQGDTPEERVGHLAEYLVRQSPRGRAILETVVSETRASAQTEIESLRAEHAAAVADLQASWQQKLTTAVAEARAEVRTGQQAPPRSGQPFGLNVPSGPVRPSMEGGRSRLAAGIRARTETMR